MFCSTPVKTEVQESYVCLQQPLGTWGWGLALFMCQRLALGAPRHLALLSSCQVMWLLLGAASMCCQQHTSGYKSLWLKYWWSRRRQDVALDSPGSPVLHGPTGSCTIHLLGYFGACFLWRFFGEDCGDVYLPAMLHPSACSFRLPILPQMDNTLFEGNVLKVNRARRQAPREPRSYDNGGGGGGGGYYQRGGGGGYNGEGSPCCLLLRCRIKREGRGKRGREVTGEGLGAASWPIPCCFSCCCCCPMSIQHPVLPRSSTGL